MKISQMLFVGILLVGCIKKVNTSTVKSEPGLANVYQVPNTLPPEENAKIWSQYCIGNPNEADIPSPNYDNPELAAVAKTLSRISPTSFALYSDVMKVYANGGKLPAVTGFKLSKDAHKFLVYMCGEFRDRASMIKAKLDWMAKLYILPTTPQQPIDPNRDLWAQFSAHSYSDYLNLSLSYYTAKQNELSSQKFTLGSYANIDKPVPATTRCEIKYMLSEYVSKKKTFDDLSKFRTGLDAYTKTSCTPDDLAYYIDFRGDPNFKPNSPESNGMIFYNRTIARNCSAPAKSKVPNFTDEQCRAYFSKPFQSRWMAARAGLAAWLLRDRKHDAYYKDTGNLVTIIPHFEPHMRPFGFKLGHSNAEAGTLLENWEQYWNRGDLGFNEHGKGSLHDFYYSRLRDVVDRHTDWYASGYDDGFGTENSVYDQAYSPMVASSYEMSASNGFTGTSISGKVPGDGYRHWMFVFKVKKENWYNTESVSKKQTPDFDNNWFDETSLGTTGLAKHEKAFDRLGTPLEGEFESILYLHSISTSGQVFEYDETLPHTLEVLSTEELKTPTGTTFLKASPEQSSALMKQDPTGGLVCELKPGATVYVTKDKNWNGQTVESDGNLRVTLRDYVDGCEDKDGKTKEAFKRGASIYIYKKHYKELPNESF